MNQSGCSTNSQVVWPKLVDHYNTSGDIFPGINFRGVQIASDDNMLPDSQKGFAPVIHGIARGTALVSIKQNGFEIYQVTVPPGPFTINDLYAAGNNGDFRVSVKEADDSVQVYTVPFATIPILQREGHSRFAFTVGEYRNGNGLQEKPKLFQGTWIQGLPRGLTAYGGMQLAERYRAFNLGIGKNMGQLGAISFDIAHANSKLPDDSEHQGQSLRFLYNKSLNDIGTNIQLVGYRYSTQGYYDLTDTTYQRMKGYQVRTSDGIFEVKPEWTNFYNLAYSKRGRLQLSVTQQAGKNTTLYVNASHQTYWGTNNADQQVQVGLNTSAEDINWSVSYSLTKNNWQDERDQLLAFNLSVPFSHWLRSDNKSVWRNASATYSMSHDLNDRVNSMAGLYGTLLENRNLSYSVQTGYTHGGVVGTGSNSLASLNYRGGYGSANLGYSRSDGFNQLYYGVSGGMVAHANGITFGQPLNDTTVLVKAPGAANAKVENQTGVFTDWRGYAVLPYASDYRENRNGLDMTSLANNVELDDSVVSVVPTHGAVVRAEFNAHVGIKVLMTLLHEGKPLPFGAVVTSEDSKSSSIVGDNGQVYLSGMPLSGKVAA
ncbi:MAG: Outer membrane usher protein FimD [Candidatus Erwinia impunctatus]|nr:Outer membrane usher protein FimD [Culicoides impunctatus]